MIVYCFLCTLSGIGFWVLGRLYESHRSTSGEHDVKSLKSLTMQQGIYATLETNDRLPSVSTLKEIVPVSTSDNSRWKYPNVARCISHPYILYFNETHEDVRGVCLHCGKMAEWKHRGFLWDVKNGKSASTKEHRANNPQDEEWFNLHKDCP